jgi:hypothetical protein
MDIIDRNRTLQIINAAQIRPIAEWESLYPDLWMLIEVTRADQWEVYEGRLIATASDPIELVDIGKSYDERGIMTLETRGDYSESQPVFVG